MSALPEVPAGADRTDGRHRAREAAVQMLYQWEVGRTSADEVVARYFGEREIGRAHV